VVSLTNALPTTSGGTGLTSFTTNGIPYATSTSALTTGSALKFDGTTVTVNTTMASTTTYQTELILQAQPASGSTGNSTDGGVQLLFQGTTDGSIPNTSISSLVGYIETSASNNAGGLLVRARQSAGSGLVNHTRFSPLNGNIVLQQSNAGIIFNNGSALTNSTLNDYETGTWTPTDASGAGLTFSSTTGTNYIKIGKTLMLYGSITFPTTSNTTAAQINIPFTVTGLGGGFTQYTNGGTYESLTFRNSGGTGGGNTMLVTNGVSNGTAVQNVQLSGATFQFVFTGPVAF
jgi:hypothetical protein